VRVSDLMCPRVISVTPDCTVTEAARVFQRHNVGVLPVCSDDGRLRGMVTDRDLVVRYLASDNLGTTMRVQDLMSRNVASVTPDSDVRDAARLMCARQLRRLPVVEHERVVGMLSLGDLARSDVYDMEAAKALTEITRPRIGRL